MKIVKEGEIPTRKKKWWEGIELTCDNCKTIFSLEENDKPKEGIQTQWIEIDCPLCKKTVAHLLPNSI